MDYRQFEDRDSYIARQIHASSNKCTYCKTSFRDIEKYVAIVRRDKSERNDEAPIGPVLCLGVRNGREIDLFRIALYSSPLRRLAVRQLERHWHGVNAQIPAVERVGRSHSQALAHSSCVGAEINPLCRRTDVWIGSYDQLPSEWNRQFGVIFSNSFDHAFEPFQTAAAWRRVIRPGGYLILNFPEGQDAAAIDPVGRVNIDDVRQLFTGELVFFQHRGSVSKYSEFVIRMS